MSSPLKNKTAYQAAFAHSRDKIGHLTPDEIERRSLCQFDVSGGCFDIPSLGQRFRVSYPAGMIKWAMTEKDVPLDWALVLLNYLTSAKEKASAGQWVTYRDLPSGQVFYGNLERYVLKELSAWYACHDKNLLSAALDKAGFVPVLGSADLNMRIDFAPRVPVLLQFWDGDEDMPASSQMLFDRDAADQLHIEDLAVVCGIVRRWLIGTDSSTG